jgi:ABC-type lipoprotein export system ATPase subunit
MNNHNTTTYIKHDCFKNNIYKDSVELKIENFSKLFKSDSNQVISIRRINFKVNKNVFVLIKGPSCSGIFILSNVLKALEKWIYVKSKMVKSKERQLIKWS